MDEEKKANLTKVVDKVVQAINATKFFRPMETLLGVEESYSFDEAPAIYWRPVDDDGYRGPHEQPDDAVAYYETTTRLEVTAWGSDLDEALRLRDAVLITAHVLFSPNAAKPTGGGKYSKGLSTEDGVEIKFTEGFVIPIIYEEFLQALIKAVNTSGTVSDPPDDTNPETP
jgi:hypothetical protein